MSSFLKGVGRSEPHELSARVASHVMLMAESLNARNNNPGRFQEVQHRRIGRLTSVMSERLKGDPEALKALEEFVQDLKAHLKVLEYNLKARVLHPNYDLSYATAAGVSMSFVYFNLQAAESDYGIRDEPESAAA